MLEENKAFMYTTGIGIDLLAAKPELSTILVIDDVSFASKYNAYWKYNWEFGNDDNINNSGVHCIRLEDTVRIRELIKPGEAIPAGAMSVSQGFKALFKLEREGRLHFKVPTWPL